MSYNYSQTADGAVSSSYYATTSDGDFTTDTYDKTSGGEIFKTTNSGNFGYFAFDYGYFYNDGWNVSSYTDKSETINASGVVIANSTTYYNSTVDGDYTSDYYSKTNGGQVYKQTDTGNYGEYYLYNGTDKVTYTDKSAWYSSDGVLQSQDTSYYGSTANGDYTTDTYDKTSGGTVYKSTNTGNYGYFFNDYGYFYNDGWGVSNYTDKSETINSSGQVTANSTSYYNSTADGDYTSDYYSKTSGGQVYKQTDSGNYGEYYLYNGTDKVTYTDKSAWYSSDGVLQSQDTSYYGSTANGDYTTDTYDKTSGGTVYKSTNTGNYGYFFNDYGYFYNDGWGVSNYTDKSETINSSGQVTANSTSYYNSTADGDYTSDYYSKTSGGDVYKTTDSGNYGEYYFSLLGGDQNYYVDKIENFNSAGVKTSYSTSYYNATSGGAYVDDYQYSSSSGVYKYTNSGNYTTGAFSDTTQYFNSAGDRTGYNTTSSS